MFDQLVIILAILLSFSSTQSNQKLNKLTTPNQPKKVPTITVQPTPQPNNNVVQQPTTGPSKLAQQTNQIKYLIDSAVNTTKINLDPASYPITFVRAEFDFDPQKFQLTSEIFPSDTLSTVIEKTSMSDANQTGHITLVFGLPPKSTPPTTLFELATFNYTSTQSEKINLTLSASGQQVVDSNLIGHTPSF